MALEIPANVKTGSTSRDYAYEILLHNITTMALRPGEVIRDAELSQELSVSRTPVREALNTLREERLVTVGSATRVALIDFGMVYEGVYIRTAVETLLAEDICGRLGPEQSGRFRENLELQRLAVEGNVGGKNFCELDDEFHRLFYEFAGRDFSYEIVCRACRQLNRIRSWTFLRTEINTREIYELHCEMFRAAAEGDAARLKSLSRDHCFGTWVNNHSPQLQATLLREHPEYFTDPGAVSRCDSSIERMISGDMTV